MGVWIEIQVVMKSAVNIVSLPAWECGLKSTDNLRVSHNIIVTPCVGVWIEIHQQQFLSDGTPVTPCVGVWIEIDVPIERKYSMDGHSLRGSVD